MLIVFAFFFLFLVQSDRKEKAKQLNLAKLMPTRLAAIIHTHNIHKKGLK